MIRIETNWQEEAISLLKMLVEIPSPSGEENAASVALLTWMESNGYQSTIDDVGNCIGTRGSGPNEIMLLGHIDTVASQLPVTLEDGCLAGRGAVDAKGPLATFAVAAALVSIPDDWRITVIGAVEEEAPTSRGARHLLKCRKNPHYCVIGEPSQWDRITIGYKGLLLMHIQMKIEQSHASGQYQLPAERAIEFWNTVKVYCDKYNRNCTKLFDQIIPSLRSINSNLDGSVGIIDLELSFRLPVDSDTDELVSKIREIAVGCSISNLQIDILGNEKAIVSPKNTPLARAFISAIRQAHGSPRLVYKTGTSDMNVVGSQWNCPIIAYGPGDSGLDHMPGERINLAEYTKSVEILHGALGTLLAVENDLPSPRTLKE